MPASEIMEDFRKHRLHSGRGGKIVRKKKQAKAILLSYLRKEGKIPEREEAGRSKRRKIAPTTATRRQGQRKKAKARNKPRKRIAGKG